MPLLASSGSLGTGIHTARFIIADVGDSVLDSAVFIQAGSFSPDNPFTPVPLPAPALLLLAGLGSFAVLRRRAS